MKKKLAIAIIAVLLIGSGIIWTTWVIFNQKSSNSSNQTAKDTAQNKQNNNTLKKDSSSSNDKSLQSTSPIDINNPNISLNHSNGQLNNLVPPISEQSPAPNNRPISQLPQTPNNPNPPSNPPSNPGTPPTSPNDPDTGPNPPVNPPNSGTSDQQKAQRKHTGLALLIVIFVSEQ